jgi:hypothetical protein
MDCICCIFSLCKKKENSHKYKNIPKDDENKNSYNIPKNIPNNNQNNNLSIKEKNRPPPIIIPK